MIPYNIYEIDKAHRNFIQESVNREHLAAIARASCTKPGPVTRLMSAIQRIAGMQRAPDTRPSSINVQSDAHA